LGAADADSSGRSHYEYPPAAPTYRPLRQDTLQEDMRTRSPGSRARSEPHEQDSSGNVHQNEEREENPNY
ncbi:MAG: hypothetical protein AAGB31_05910, partial [Bdellovibrio sp.]